MSDQLLSSCRLSWATGCWMRRPAPVAVSRSPAAALTVAPEPVAAPAVEATNQDVPTSFGTLPPARLPRSCARKAIVAFALAIRAGLLHSYQLWSFLVCKFLISDHDSLGSAVGLNPCLLAPMVRRSACCADLQTKRHAGTLDTGGCRRRNALEACRSWSGSLRRRQPSRRGAQSRAWQLLRLRLLHSPPLLQARPLMLGQQLLVPMPMPSVHSADLTSRATECHAGCPRNRLSNLQCLASATRVRWTAFSLSSCDVHAPPKAASPSAPAVPADKAQKPAYV